MKTPVKLDRPDENVTYAVKALAKGIANEGQQKTALDWIVKDLCKTYDLSYRPDSDRDTCFAEGKRFIGLMIIHEININPELVRRKDESSRRSRK